MAALVYIRGHHLRNSSKERSVADEIASSREDPSVLNEGWLEVILNIRVTRLRCELLTVPNPHLNLGDTFSWIARKLQAAVLPIVEVHNVAFSMNTDGGSEKGEDDRFEHAEDEDAVSSTICRTTQKIWSLYMSFEDAHSY